MTIAGKIALTAVALGTFGFGACAYAAEAYREGVGSGYRKDDVALLRRAAIARKVGVPLLTASGVLFIIAAWAAS